MANFTAQATSDIDLISAVIGAEQGAQAAYAAAAKTGLLKPEVLAVATKIAQQHADHEKAWTTELTKLGGKVPAPPTLNLPPLNSQEDILKYALGLEVAAANAYFDVLQKLSTKTLKQLSASVMADESQHVVVLSSALGMQPFNATSFMPLKAS